MTDVRKPFTQREMLPPTPLSPTKHLRKICLPRSGRCASEANNCWLFTIRIHALLIPNPQRPTCDLPTIHQRFTLLLDSAVNDQSEGSWEPVEYEIVADANH